MALRKRTLGGLVALLLLATPAAYAGTRTTTGNAPAFPAVTDLATTSGTVATTASASTVTTEVLATGGQWTVTAQVCGPDDYTTPVTADCTNHGNEILSATGSIPGSQITLNRGAIETSGTPHGTATAGSETTLAGPVVLMTSSNENPVLPYNGTYSVTTGLTIANLSSTGTWKGYWVITQMG